MPCPVSGLLLVPSPVAIARNGNLLHETDFPGTARTAPIARLRRSSMPRISKRTKRTIAAVYEKAKGLGPIVPVAPVSRHSADGSPVIGATQAYVTFTGEVYHPLWCRIVADKWDNDPNKLVVIELATVGGRREDERGF